MHKLVLIRHGQSTWNQQNRFTGWTDIDLTSQGEGEARAAGELLEEAGFTFDIAFTSVLKRAIRTLWFVLDAMDLMWIPTEHSWRLNERHYGALQGLNKAETTARYGAEQVHAWRRSYDVAPPPLEENDTRASFSDPRYAMLTREEIPLTECLKDTVERVLPAWHGHIAPALRAGKRVVIVAHGNSLRALIKYLDGINDLDIAAVNVPTGRPLIYELSDALWPERSYYLGGARASAPGTTAVVAHGKSK